MKMTAMSCGVLLMLMSACSTVSIDEFDPYDKKKFDPSFQKQKLPEMPVTDKKDKTESPSNKGDNSGAGRQVYSPCHSLFRHHVKTLLYHIKGKVYGGAEELNLRLMMTEADVDFLEKFTNSCVTDKDVRHVREILSSMIKLASEVEHGDPTVHRLWVERLEKVVMQLASLIFIVGLLFGAVHRLHISCKKLTIAMVIILFVISFFWQWFELYKKGQALQQMTIMKGMPEECRKQEKEESYWNAMYLYLKTIVTFKDDTCKKYYLSLQLDPFITSNPVEALAKTVVRFFVSPAREIGEAVQELLTGTLKGLPVQLWPVALGFIGVFSFLLLFMSFGYRFSLPFGLIAIEPVQRADNSKFLEEMEHLNNQLLQLQESQRKVMRNLQENIRQDREKLSQEIQGHLFMHQHLSES